MFHLISSITPCELPRRTQLDRDLAAIAHHLWIRRYHQEPTESESIPCDVERLGMHHITGTGSTCLLTYGPFSGTYDLYVEVAQS